MFWKIITIRVAPSRPRPGGEQTDRAAGTERDLHGGVHAAGPGRGGGADVGPGREPHAEEADEPGEERPAEEGRASGTGPTASGSRPSSVPALRTSVEVTNTMTASGTTMIRIVRNWRLMYAIAPSWTAAAISFIFSVPDSLDRTLAHHDPADDERDHGDTTAAKISQNHSEPWQ